jgi:hypothetical protein
MRGIPAMFLDPLKAKISSIFPMPKPTGWTLPKGSRDRRYFRPTLAMMFRRYRKAQGMTGQARRRMRNAPKGATWVS